MNNLDFTNLKENTTHGDFILPFSIYKGTISPSFPSIATHWHEEIEVIIVLDGSCNYRINLDSFLINKGDILIIGSQSLHSLTSIPNKNMTWASFVFNINMLKSSSTDGALLKYIDPLLNHEHQLPIIIKDNTTCYSKIFDVIENILYCYYDKDIAYELELKSLLFKFFSLLYSSSSKSSLSSISPVDISLSIFSSFFIPVSELSIERLPSSSNCMVTVPF